MPSELSQLDERYKELRNEIDRLFSDPLAAIILEAYYNEHQAQVKASSNGNHAAAKEQSHPNRTSIEIKPADHGNQTQYVRGVLKEIDGGFTVATIGDQLRASGIELTNTQVGKVFARLLKFKELRAVRRGKGSSPSKYTKTQKFKPEG